MLRFRKNSLASCVLLLCATMAMIHFSLPRILSKQVQRLPDSAAHSVMLPHFSPDHFDPRTSENEPAQYAYTFDITYAPLQQSRFNIHPLGCIQKLIINDATYFDFSQKNGEGKLCTSTPLEMVPDQFMNGISVDFSEQLRPGKNTITIIMYNGGMRQEATFFKAATYGMQFGPVIFSKELRLSTWGGLLFTGLLVYTLLLLARRATQEWVGGAALSISFLITVWHMATTSFMKFAPDMPSHLEYIAYIANHRTWPSPFIGWQYYQPALYYQLQAWLMQLGNALGTFDTVMLLQFFSLLCFTVFSFFSVMTLRRLISVPLAYYCAIAFVLFYQGGIIYSARLDSHLPYYAFYAASGYFLISWLQSSHIRDGQVSWGLFSLALATRSNALSFALCQFIAICHQWRSKALRWGDLRTWRTGVVVLLLLLAALSNFGRTFYYNIAEHTNMPYLVSNSRGLPRSHIIENNLGNFLWVDMDAISATPFWHLKYDNAGRQNFWVSIFKTSLFDFYQWPNPAMAKSILYLLLLNVLFVLCSFGLLWRRILSKIEGRALLVLLLIPIGSLMLNRIIHPYSASQNFRYIYPVIISFAGLYGLLLEQYFLQRRYIAIAAGTLLIAALALLSSAFILLL